MKSTWIALGVLLSITLLGRCRDDDASPTPRPAVVWGGREYVATWRAGSNIYLQYEDQRPRRVYSNRNARSQPTLHQRSHGYILGTAANDPREPDWRTEVMVWLDYWGYPERPPILRPHIISADRLCEVRQHFGDRIAVTAFISEPRDDSRAWFLGIGSVDADGDGEPGTSAMLITLERPISCFVATRGPHAVWAIRYPDSISVHFHDLRDLKRDGPEFEITDVSNDAPWDLALTPAFDSAQSFAILHRDRSHRMHVTHFNPSGILDTKQLPADVNAATADLSVNFRGLFVARITGRKLHVRGVTAGEAHTRRVPARSGIRASGMFDHCMIAVRPPTSNRIQFERFDYCVP